MKKKKLFCLIFFCFVVIPVFCKNQFTVNKSFSIQQVEPKEKDIEVRTQKFSFSIKKDSMIKHEIIDNNDFVSTFQIKNEKNTFTLNCIKDNSIEKLYTITFKPENKVLINNTDVYLLKDDSYLKLYNDLLSNRSIISIFQFLSFCHYFFIDTNLQNLPFYFYNYEYMILEGHLSIQSPDSNLRLTHIVQYKYDENGNISINCNCSDENFIGLNYQVNFNYKQCKISNVTIKMKFFERKSKRYDLKFNYEKATITAFGESIHSYFTDIIKYSFATDIN